MSTQKNPLIVRSNDLVHARYRLTLTEQRLIFMAAVHAREHSDTLFSDSSVTLNIADFAKQYDLNVGDGSLYENIRKAVKLLYNRSLTITDETRTGNIRWVSEVWYKHDLTAVQLVFSPSIIPFITNLKQDFTSYRLSMVAKMTSVYAVRLYELLISRQDFETRTFTISTLREIFGLLDEYRLTGDFKKYVVAIAVDQVNQYSDLKVKYEYRKTGRKITHFDFEFKTKTPARPKITKADADKASLPGEPDNSKGYERLRKLRDSQ